MPEIQQIVEIAVYVDDLPRAARFCRDPAGNSIELITPGCWGLPSGW